jgi:hypothetical protein
LAGPAKGGGGNEGIFHYVIENTCRKNVAFWPFHDVIENNCTYTSLSIICMKIKEKFASYRRYEKWYFQIAESLSRKITKF